MFFVSALVSFVWEGVWYLALATLVQWLYSLTKNPNKADASKRDPVQKKVIIIGAGVSGLVTAKELRADGHDVEVYEKEACIGGVWKQDSDASPVWQDLITTSSASVNSFSDYFPAAESVSPEETKLEQHKKQPFHMSCQQYSEYINNYVEEFKLADCIRTKWEVDSAVQKADNTWELTMHNLDAKEEENKVVEAQWVVVACGQHQQKTNAKIPGMRDFKGEVIHSSEYVNAEPFTGKKVLIIGGGDSGSDITAQVAAVASETHVSLRNGAHVTPRYFHKDKHPLDYSMFRWGFYLPHSVRVRQRDADFQGHIERVYDYEDDVVMDKINKVRMLNGMQEEEYFTTKSAMMCEAFAAGKAVLKTEVQQLTEGGASFKTVAENANVINVSDDKAVDLDAIILATGYTQSFGFLPKAVAQHNHLARYKLVFHPDLPNMAFVGFVRPSGLGAIAPLAEMQARWVSAVVGERVDLPSAARMRECAAANTEAYAKQRKHGNEMLVDFAYYANDIAGQIGVRPHMFDIFKQDRTLWWQLLTKPFTLHQYRLQGIHAKPEVATNIISEKISMPVELHATPLTRPHPIKLLLLSAVSGMVAQLPGMASFESGLLREY